MPNSEHSANELSRTFCYSYLRCVHDPLFYIALHEQFECKAAGFLNTCSSGDLKRQKIMLEVATSSILQISYSGKSSVETSRLARAFTDLGILLDETVIKVWLDSLLAAVSSVDVECNDLILAAWRRSFYTGIELFQAYQQSHLASLKLNVSETESVCSSATTAVLV